MNSSSSKSSTTKTSPSPPLSCCNEQHIEEAIEYSFANQLSISAMDVLAKIKSDTNQDGNQEVTKKDCFQKEIEKFKLHSFTIEHNHLERMKPKSVSETESKSIFDLFAMSSESQSLHQRKNIRDVLESSGKSILEICYEAKIDDLIMGFNTTNEEVEQLSCVIFDNLIVESSSVVYNSEHLAKSYLDLHMKWMKDCVALEECHSFAFVILRNMILSLQHDQIPGNQDQIVMYTIHMLKEYLKIWNDGTQFQKSSLQILFLMIKIFFKREKSSTGLYVLLAQHDTRNKLFQRLISCTSSKLVLRRIVLNTNFIKSLYCAISDEIGTVECKIFNASEETRQSHNNIQTFEYLISIIHDLFLNLGIVHSASSTFVKDFNNHDDRNKITIEDGILFLYKVENSTDVMRQNDSNDIKSLLKPFFILFDMGLEPNATYFFREGMVDIIKDTVVQIIVSLVEDSNKSPELLQDILELLRQRLTRMSLICENEEEQIILFTKDDSGFIKLSSTPECILQIYKSIFLHVSLHIDFPAYLEMEKDFTIIVQFLHQCLLHSRNHGHLNVSFYNNTVSLLMLYGQKHDLVLGELITHFLVDYEMEMSSQKFFCTETMMLIYCLLYEANNVEHSCSKHQFVTKIKRYCFGRFFPPSDQAKKINCASLIHTFDPQIRNKVRSSNTRTWVKELILSKTLKDEITDLRCRINRNILKSP